MDFYQSIAKHYENIFPLKPAQVGFAQKVALECSAKSLLDIGCATGAFAMKMGEQIDEVFAFDLDSDMVEIAKSKNQNTNVHFIDGNMLDIDKLYEGQEFDMVTCFGNTLVHLSNKELKKVFSMIKAHLNGVLLIQILNYDYVINENIKELPLIDSDVISFKRYYNHKSQEELEFKTILKIKNDNIEINNKITLYPLRKIELDKALREAGFRDISYYKNYNEDAYSGNHLPLIIKAK